MKISKFLEFSKKNNYENYSFFELWIQGSLKMPTIGRSMLTVLRNAEKLFWYTDKVTEEFMLRGFTTEVRQFSNELVTTAEIWGLQLPFLVGKRNQVSPFFLDFLDFTKI